MRRAAKVDSTAKALVTLARDLGAYVIPINGVIDALLYTPRKGWIVVDWKSKGGSLTPAQQKFVLDRVPVEFISTPEQLKALLQIKE